MKFFLCMLVESLFFRAETFELDRETIPDMLKKWKKYYNKYIGKKATKRECTRNEETNISIWGSQNINMFEGDDI